MVRYKIYNQTNVVDIFWNWVEKWEMGFCPIDALKFLCVPSPEEKWEEIKKEKNTLFDFKTARHPYDKKLVELVSFYAILELQRRYPIKQNSKLNNWKRWVEIYDNNRKASVYRRISFIGEC